MRNNQANTRGGVNLGWLDSKHTFSFSRYYNPERMNFGALRVLNDDIVQPAMGFGTHSHENMEIVSIPLSGALAHKDSTGRSEIIKSGEVQIMSAGTGIAHSEFNASESELVNFLQVWILPKEIGIKPRYEQKPFDDAEKENQFKVVVSPIENSESIWINQDAYFSLAYLNEGKEIEYKVHHQGNGVYFFVIEGEAEIGEEKLSKRDGIGVSEVESVKVRSTTDSKILAIEVPMN